MSSLSVLLCLRGTGCHKSWTFKLNCFGKNCTDVNVRIILKQKNVNKIN